MLDRRLHAYRPDLADKSLVGKVEAEHFTEGVIGQVLVGAAPVRPRPEATAPLDTEALYGERVTVFDRGTEWSWVQLARDRYVGYVPTAALANERFECRHSTAARVAVPRTFLYPEPDIKSPPLAVISLGCEIAVVEDEGRFARLVDGSQVIAAHLVRSDEPGDFVAAAELLIGTPYLWGGKTSVGLDCSGLVQSALHAAGQDCPRDSDMQEAALGQRIGGPGDLAMLHRGDLVFWKGHVGIMCDSANLLHANGHHMLTVIEPVADAVARAAATGSEVISLKRLVNYSS